MLSPDDRKLANGADASVEERVRRLVVETTGGVATTGPLLGAALDSLTLIAIVTRLEAAFAIELDSDEIVVLLGSRDWHDLAALVARKLAERHANLARSTGNRGC
jgi:acyl carrier protein